MGGFLGIGGSSAKTDRATQLAAQQGEWNIFNYGLTTGQKGQQTGQNELSQALSTLGPAQSYFQSLLSPSRQQVAQRSAPSIAAVEGQAQAQRGAAFEFGSSRVGGTAASQNAAEANTQSSIDQIINQNLVQGQQEGAQGLEQVSSIQSSIAGQELSNSLSLLGLSQESINAIMSNATNSRAESAQLNSQMQQQFGAALSQGPSDIADVLMAVGA